MFFRNKRSTQLKKLMNAYYDWHSVYFNSTAFLLDGCRLRVEQTQMSITCLEADPIYEAHRKWKEDELAVSCDYF
ncbi:small ubiquitin-related modifier 2 [Phtheirospermum japonicum]|uniref:Small ubiquitin-related modifier 2 n=1 Tax=Phtheirospermum japonicum TaxID=374723 RepID=A0A830DAN5_9LAMI|nr:small ubiquitin-related modifier 2 [Phtheirospermum japonicum]